MTKQHRVKVIYNNPDNYAIIVTPTNTVYKAIIEVSEDGRTILTTPDFNMKYVEAGILLRDWTIVDRRLLIEKTGRLL